MKMSPGLPSTEKAETNRKAPIYYIMIVICCLLFIFTTLLLQSNLISNNIKGIISQIQLMISIYLALNYKKFGYALVIMMNSFLTIMVTIAIVKGDLPSLPGLVIYVSTAIVVTLLYRYYTRLNLKIIEVTENEKALSEQNLKLREYNGIMEDNKARLDYLANYDYLTDLPNRKMIINRIQLLIDQKENFRGSFAVVFIDIDNFKNINDTMGHEVGDSVLIAVSSRLKSLVNPNDMAGRLGGDELALIIQHFESDDATCNYLKSIKESLHKTLEIDNFRYKATASFGVSIYPKDGENAMELLKNADTAMYKAKAIGKNSIKFFTNEMREEVLNKVSIETNLKQALVNNEIYLVFQPQYASVDKKLKGFEVLARWNSSELGFISPLGFIKVAEETGFIIPLGYWIFDKSLKNLKKWKAEYKMDIKLSINISSVQIMSVDFVENIQRLLEKNEVNGKDVILEITESIFISSMQDVMDILNQLRSLGLSIALDDFGTGYSSLSYLRSLPISLLKIDKSFIDDIHKDEEENTLVASIIQLSRALGISVVAEGVETERQLQYLKDHNCNYIQGYLWGKPLTEEEAEKILMEEQNKVC